MDATFIATTGIISSTGKIVYATGAIYTINSTASAAQATMRADDQ